MQREHNAAIGTRQAARIQPLSGVSRERAVRIQQRRPRGPTQSNVVAFGPRRKRSAAGDQNGSITKCVSEINYAFRERCDRHQFVLESIPPRPCCSNSTRVPARRREGKEEDAEADEMARPTHPLLLLCVIVAAQLLAPAGAAKFACNARGGAARCQSLLGYTPRNATTLASVMSLFQVRSFRSILAANGLPLSTPPSRPVPAGATVRVRFACACSAGHGTSMHRPFYKVAPGETLDGIARGVFAGFVTYQEIAAANNISDPALVQAGRELHVPLPCSCDEVEGAAVMHYAHLVAAGSSVKGIAAEPAKFWMFHFEVCFARCSSPPPSRFLPLPNSYRCITCSLFFLDKQRLHRPRPSCPERELHPDCKQLRPLQLQLLHLAVRRSFCLKHRDHNLTTHSSSSLMAIRLECHPTKGLSSSACPAATCGDVVLGNSSSSTECESKTCVYGGYTNTTAASFNILTNLTTQSLCDGKLDALTTRPDRFAY
ncbi:hypothetical protein BHE74_00040944 [Ensete ventricosum]|nr:hypothetical protein BHE74_00040944 [Ensete ventricosum]RZS17599.1 hypothetical protein BHM03_00049746 [Ensete ventricosum]